MTREKRRGGHSCPHCKATAVIYATRKVTELVTEKWLQCTAVECGFNFVVQVGVVRAIVPSLIPDPTIQVPLVQRRANDIVVARTQTNPMQSPFKAVAPAKATDAPTTQPTH